MRNSPAQKYIPALQHPVAPVTREERERVLARAAEVGAAQAGRELGIAPGTIRVWRPRAAARADNGGRVDTPGYVSGVDPADTWTTAQEARRALMGRRTNHGGVDVYSRKQNEWGRSDVGAEDAAEWWSEPEPEERPARPEKTTICRKGLPGCLVVAAPYSELCSFCKGHRR